VVLFLDTWENSNPVTEFLIIPAVGEVAASSDEWWMCRVHRWVTGDSETGVEAAVLERCERRR
jgi:hypothetical protein